MRAARRPAAARRRWARSGAHGSRSELAWEHQRGAYVAVFDRLVGVRSTRVVILPDAAGADERAAQREPDDVRRRRRVPAAGRRRRRPHDGRADRPPRSGRRAASATVDAAERRVQLGHRRLSIIDLSTAADQPFVKDGLTLSYNGELYNYRELRAELEGRGVRFVTQSDTEVVLEAWRHWGTGRAARGSAGCSRSRSTTSGTRHAARWPATRSASSRCTSCRAATGVVFASELKAIVARRRARADRSTRRALVASTLYYFVPEEFDARSRACTSCPPGSWAESRATAPARRHGTGTPPTRPRPAAQRPPADLARGDRGVGRRPPGRRRAGGVVPQRRPRLQHRSPRWPRGATRRSRPTRSPSGRRTSAWRPCPTTRVYARKMAAHLGIRLHEIEISPDVVDMLPRIVDILDEPIGDPAAINTVLMCEAARDAGVKVLLSGMGADELFGGYRKHLACLLGAPLPAAVPAAVARARRRARRRPAARRGRRPRAAATAAGPSASSPSPSCPRRRRSGAATPSTTATSSPACSTPALAGDVDAVIDGAPRDVRTTAASPTTSTGCAWPTPGCSCRGSTSPTPTARAWRRPPRCGCRSSTRSSSGRRSRFPGDREDPGPDARRSPLQARSPEQWLPERDHRPSEGLVRGAAARLGDQRPRRRSIDDVLLDGELVGVGLPAPAAAACSMVADQRSRPAGRVQAAVAAAVDGALVPQRSGAGVGAA